MYCECLKKITVVCQDMILWTVELEYCGMSNKGTVNCEIGVLWTVQ